MDIHIHLTLSRRVVAAALGALLLAVPLAELGSESVTLTTYYPAPSGVYVKLIATADTYLARDAGSVGLRTTTPQALLDVNGTSVFRGNLTVLGGDAAVSGSLKVGLDAAVCSSVKAGSLRWTGASLQACDGTAWRNIQLN